MITLRLPRRYHRPLLLPRGLVALGFLLLIGCRVLVNQPRLHRYSIMQLTMPVVCSEQGDKFGFCLSSARKITKLSPSQTFDFSGRTATDSSVMQQIHNQLRAMSHKHTLDGLAVRFHGHARYGSLVDVLDEINQRNLSKYFLDIHSFVTTLYVLPLRKHDSPTVSDDADAPRIEPPPATSGLSRWLNHIGSHLNKPAWGTGLLAVGSVWLSVALGRWLLQDE